MGNVKSKEEVPDEAIAIREDTASQPILENKVSVPRVKSGIESVNGAAAGTSATTSIFVSTKDQQAVKSNANSSNLNQKQVNHQISST